MTDHIPDAGKKVSTPKNLDGMVVDVDHLNIKISRIKHDLPAFAERVVETRKEME